MAGILVWPPTKITSLMSLTVKFFSAKVCSTNLTDLTIISPTNSSNLALVNFMTKCFGPEASEVINGKLISDSIVVESSCLALSAASFNLCKAKESLDKSIPSCFLNSETK